MPMWIQFDGRMVSFDMMTTLGYIKRLHGDMHWHFNKCGCCVTAHTSQGDYLIGSDGNFDFFPKEGEGNDSPLVI